LPFSLKLAPFYYAVFNEPSLFNVLVPTLEGIELSKLAAKALYAYIAHNHLVHLEKKLGKRSLQYGYSLRYGKYAVVYASFVAMNSGIYDNLHVKSLDDIEKDMTQNVSQILDKWKLFEDFATKIETNKAYFDPAQNLSDFASYYKGPTLANDIQKYFQRVKA
jgi:hypothetical protein